MKRAIILLVAIIASAQSLTAQRTLEPAIDSIVHAGIDYILKQDYAQANLRFQQLAGRCPHHPSGYLYQAAVMQAQAIDYDVLIKPEPFDSLLKAGRKAAASFPSPMREYFLGTADGYEAYERVERGDWLGGVSKGMSSANRYDEVLTKDSSFYDAYVGVGTYDYWSSRKTSFIRWLPLVSDNRQKGIALLKQAAEHSEYNRFAAISALISIYLDAEDYRAAEEWSRRGLASYPSNRVFLWGLVTAQDRQKKYREAVVGYEQLLANILSAHLPHPYGEIVCRLNLVKAKLAVGDATFVRNHLDTIRGFQTIPFPAHLQSRAAAKFKDAEQARADLPK